MNKRIKELAEQAGQHADTYDDTSTPIWFQMYNEKFAELIVRECIEIVEAQKESLCTNVGTWTERDFGYFEAITDTGAMVKQCFGVEE